MQLNAEYGLSFGADAYCVDAGVGVATANTAIDGPAKARSN